MVYLSLFIVVISVFIGLVLVEYYSYQACKTLVEKRMLKLLWKGLSSIIYVNLLFAFLDVKIQGLGQTGYFRVSVGLLLMILVPKIIIMFVLFFEDIVRLFQRIFISQVNTIPSRKKFLSQIALVMGSIPFAGIIYGMILGKYNYKVIKYKLFFEDLPEAFDGFTLTHISDIHSGSLEDKDKVSYAIDLINSQKSDIVLFTGDIVNNLACEMDDWISLFKSIKAPYGKFSVLGNHDYGDYVKWDSDVKKLENFEAIKDIHTKIGFDLLLNEHRYLYKNDQKIALIGVENWGKKFIQKGDLKKASSEVSQQDFKILMTHDPSHWEEVVKKDQFNYQLSLSGHTHGMQFGIEIPGFVKWSPSKYIYKQWAGLYEEFGRFINVNRGFGFHAFSGRVGIWPEISVIKLKKK